MENNATKNFVWADNLRVLATVSVIVQHVAANTLNPYNNNITTYWWIASIYDGLTRFCVPVFIILTGALLLHKEYNLGDFLKIKFSRIVLPFLFWSIIYIAFEINSRATNRYVPFSEISETAFTMLRTGSAYHMWYIYVIIGLYLFIPILGKWIRNATENEILYFLGIWFIVVLFNQPYISVFNLRPNVDLTYFSGFIGYLVLGYYLNTKKFKNTQKVNLVGLLLFLVGNFVTIYGYYYTCRGGVTNNMFYDYLAPNVIAVAIGTFLLFKNYDFKSKTSKIVAFLSKYSYGIYLVHILILSEFAKRNWYFHYENPLYNIPLNVLLCLCGSTLVIYILNRIPIIKKMAG